MFVNRKQKKEAEDGTTARRVPMQERSRQRVERILDAAAQVFSSQGHDAATMEAIAAKAETSIGSIYQFFPNKAAVFDALIARYHVTLRGFLDALLAGPVMDQAWSEIIDAAIDALAALHETDPGFRAVWVGMHLTEQVVSEGEKLNKELARRIAIVLAKKLPKLPPKRRLFVSTMVVEIVTAMLILSARRPADSRSIMTETKTLLRLYLAPYEGSGSSATGATESRTSRKKRE
jgi:AcrR family transcriptional regulator